MHTLDHARAPQNLQGNHACALGAVAAGCRFYAGYPITPSSEVAERMAIELPRVGGIFIQMEDEIASMGAVLGASLGGLKAMTATSGPGFTLLQEHLGYAAGTEIPCVIVNVMRGGPTTGMPTRPAQSDLMQARWGTHGDHPVIVLTPSSVIEVWGETVRAFNLSERYRVPVVVLYDEVVGHLIETVELPVCGSFEVIERRWESRPPQEHQPYAAGEDGVPPMARLGDGYRTHVTGLTHAEDGFPTQDPAAVDRVMRRLLGKLGRHREAIESFELFECEDAQVLVVAYGITARSAQRAVRQARARGVRAGLFRPITMWPFPERAFREVAERAAAVLVPEMSAGQLCLEVERHCAPAGGVESLGRVDGQPIAPAEILERLQELASRA
jgi:2-oxoglutarate ferredoxin oxidoreductase subunit alpha